MGRSEDVAFIVNPSIWYQSMIPSGILCLSNYLDDHGVPNVILDSKLNPKVLPFPKRIEEIKRALLRIRPKLVCFSATHQEFAEVVTMNRWLRSAIDGVVTIVGGSQATSRPSDFFSYGFDFVGVGEGEKTLLEFAREVSGGSRQWERVEGLIYKTGERITRNQRRAFLTGEEMDNRNFGAYRKIDRRYFDYNVAIIRGLPLRATVIQTGRGCPYNCSFCGCNAVFGRALRFRSIDSLDQEIRYLKHHFGIEGLWILDDTFTVNRAHVTGVSELLKRHGLLWGCQSRVDTIDEPTMKKMKECGCIQIDFGVESGSPRILKDIIGKGTRPEQVVKTFAVAKRHGIRTLANFMIGLPTETLADFDATKRLAREIRADVYVFAIATPLPGTRLYDLVGEHIAPHQYPLLNWNGSPLTDRLNKSEIRDLSRQRSRLEKQYLSRSILRSARVDRRLLWHLLRTDPAGRTRAVMRFVPAHLLGRRHRNSAVLSVPDDYKERPVPPQ